MFVMPGDRAGRQRVSLTVLAPASTYSVPALSTFSWVNQGTSTATQTVANQAILLNMQTSASLNWRIMQAAQPTTPFKIVAQLRSGQALGTNSQTAGIYFYDGTKLMGIEILTQVSPSNVMRVEKITNVTTDSSTPASTTVTGAMAQFAPSWLQLRNSGSSVFFDFSLDGQNFINLYNEAIGTFITPTSIGFGGAETVTTANLYVSLLSWTLFGNANLNG